MVELENRIAKSPAQLESRSTPKYLSASGHSCGRNRPCYREGICDRCYRRRRRFIVDQFLRWSATWEWTRFYTVSLMGFFGNDAEGLRLLVALRKRVHPSLYRYSKVFSVISVSPGKPIDSRATTLPHFHIVTSRHLSPEKVKRAFFRSVKQICPHLCCDFHDVDIPATESDRKGVVGYLLDMNFRPCIEPTVPTPTQRSYVARPHRVRLICASQPFQLGKPRYAPECNGE